MTAIKAFLIISNVFRDIPVHFLRVSFGLSVGNGDIF